MRKIIIFLVLFNSTRLHATTEGIDKNLKIMQDSINEYCKTKEKDCQQEAMNCIVSESLNFPQDIVEALKRCEIKTKESK